MDKSAVEKVFGAHAAAYATSAVHAAGESLQAVIAALRPEADWRVLDVATGAGHMAAAMAPLVAEVVACDLTFEMLEQASKLAAERGLANMKTARGNAEALPFAEQSFDAVTCRIAAHHFPQPQRFVAEVARVLKPGGLFALVDNVAPDSTTQPQGCRDDLVRAGEDYNAFEALRDPSHHRALTVNAWRELIGNAGLDGCEVTLLTKTMELEPWARRLSCDAAMVARLAGILGAAEGALAAHLAPQQTDGQWRFTLTEGLLVARKP